jgi:hypothetical protein
LGISDSTFECMASLMSQSINSPALKPDRSNQNVIGRRTKFEGWAQSSYPE